MQPIRARTTPLSKPAHTVDAIRDAFLRFIAAARSPIAIEPGEDPMALTEGFYSVEMRGGRLVLEAWGGDGQPGEERAASPRVLVRKLAAIQKEGNGRLELETEQFGNRRGQLLLLDLANPATADAARKGGRMKYREQFRLALRRQFPEWRIAELTSDADLEHSLSPVYPRALLRQGSRGIAAIGAAEDSPDPDGILSFGLIWLDYLRRREPKFTIGGLLLFVPIGCENTTCHRVRFLNPNLVKCAVYVHGSGIAEERVNPDDYTNLATRLEPVQQSLFHAGAKVVRWVEQIEAIPGVTRRNGVDGSVSLAVNGLEFARVPPGGQGNDATLEFGGIGFKRERGFTKARDGHLPEIEALARGLVRLRNADAEDRSNPLFRRNAESWLEARICDEVEEIDASLLRSPVYRQAPAMAGGTRGVLDLVACDMDGRLAVIEVKADEDIHLPMQALDYWMRVKWHLERGEFQRGGYFPGTQLRRDPPRLLLVAPALDFHPENATLLKYFSSNICVERAGVGIEWRRKLQVMFRA